MTLGQRIRQLMEDEDISQRQMAKELNLATSTLNGYLCDTRQPDYSVLSAIARYLSVSVDYLIGNTDLQTMNKLSAQETDLVHLFRALTPEQQELLIEQTKLYIRHNKKKAETSSHSA